MTDKGADPGRVRGAKRLEDQVSYQSPVIPSRSIGLPSNAQSALILRERNKRLTFAGRDHVIRIILFQGGERNVRNGSGVTMAGQRNILSRFRSHRDRVECRGATVAFLAEAEGRSKRALGRMV